MRDCQAKPPGEQISLESPMTSMRWSMSSGRSRGDSPSRSARKRISSQLARGGSSSRMAMGAFRWPVQASNSSFAAPPFCATGW